MSYPIMLHIDEKQAVVIGGGQVATRRVQGLLEAGANVTVVAPRVTRALCNHADAGELRWIQDTFKRDYLKAAWLIIAATNDREVNLHVYEVAALHQLVNIVDRPDLCHFQVPSTVRRGKLTISVATGGASPTFTKNIGKELASRFDESYSSYIDFLEWAREQILTQVSDKNQRKELLQAVATEQFKSAGSWDKQLQQWLVEIKKE